MDNKPLSASFSRSRNPAEPIDDLESQISLLRFICRLCGRLLERLRSMFVGPDGIYACPRWLIYLAMAFAVFEIEGWLMVSLRSHVSIFWWRMMTEGSMMLAAILPGFVMARIEDRPFGDFGLPARRAFGRNFWVGTLWGIGSLEHPDAGIAHRGRV